MFKIYAAFQVSTKIYTNTHKINIYTREKEERERERMENLMKAMRSSLA